MQRVRELAVEAANGSLSSSDLGQINQELQQLQNEINAVAQSVEATRDYWLARGQLDALLAGALVAGSPLNQAGGR